MTWRILGTVAALTLVASCGGSNPVTPSRPPTPAPAPEPPPPLFVIEGAWSGTLQYDEIDLDSPTLKRTVKREISLSLSQRGKDVAGSFTLKDGSAGTVEGTVSSDRFGGALSMVLNSRLNCPYRGDFSGSVSQTTFQWTGQFSTISKECLFYGLGNVMITASHK